MANMIDCWNYRRCHNSWGNPVKLGGWFLREVDGGTYFPFCFCIMKASLQRYIAILDCFSSFSGYLWSQDLNTWKHHVTRDQWHCHGSNFPSFSSVWLYAESGSFVLGVDFRNHFSFSETFVPPGQLKDHHFPFNSSCCFDGYPGWNWKQIAWGEPFRRGLKTWCVRKIRVWNIDKLPSINSSSSLLGECWWVETDAICIPC